MSATFQSWRSAMRYSAMYRYGAMRYVPCTASLSTRIDTPCTASLSTRIDTPSTASYIKIIVDNNHKFTNNQYSENTQHYTGINIQYLKGICVRWEGKCKLKGKLKGKLINFLLIWQIYFFYPTVGAKTLYRTLLYLLKKNSANMVKGLQDSLIAQNACTVFPMMYINLLQYMSENVL